MLACFGVSCSFSLRHPPPEPGTGDCGHRLRTHPVKTRISFPYKGLIRIDHQSLHRGLYTHCSTATAPPPIPSPPPPPSTSASTSNYNLRTHHPRNTPPVIYFCLRVYTMLSCMLTCTMNSFPLHHSVAQEYCIPA